MSDSLQTLSEILVVIQDTALETHERLESQGQVPLIDFERTLFHGRQSAPETRASILWQCLIFTRPRIVSQRDFQNALSLRLSFPEAGFTMRQLSCAPPRIWSYRKSYQRGFAHTVTGPNCRCEISVDGCLSVTGQICQEDHLYVYGWTISFHDQIFLIGADTLSQAQVFKTESIRPFPLQISDDDFWEENMVRFIEDLYPVQTGGFVPAELVEPERTNYCPEQFYQKLQKIVISHFSAPTLRIQTLQELVATSEPKDIVEFIEKLVKRHLATKSSFSMSALMHRLLEAVGCDDDGNMPRAHDALISSDPVALLLLPEDHPIYSVCHPRDSIKQVLSLPECTDDVREAYKVYRRERRWLAAFPCFDLNLEEHALHLGIPIDSIERIFDSRLFSSALPIAPQGEVLKQIQNRFGLYRPGDAPPIFRMALEILSGRGFVRTGGLASIDRWLFSYCERYRYCLSEIEPDVQAVHRSVDTNNQQLLKKGLKDLANMFAKKKN